MMSRLELRFKGMVLGEPPGLTPLAVLYPLPPSAKPGGGLSFLACARGTAAIHLVVEVMNIERCVSVRTAIWAKLEGK
jgi:hypothetical protein